MPIQIKRTSVPNRAPVGLLPGQLAVEMASDPPKLWCGVPASIDPSLRREVGGTSVLPASLLSAQSGLRGHWAGNALYYFQVADLIVRNPINDEGIVVAGMATNCNIAVAGANGRDQPTALGANVWVHFYWIWNPTTQTLASIASLTAPPGGPNLPSGFTHWCYIGAVRRRLGAFLRVLINGDKFFYSDTASNPVLDTGMTWDAISFFDTSTYIPANANDYTLYYTMSGGTLGGSAGLMMEYDYYYLWFTQVGFAWINGQAVFPNVTSLVYYLTTNDTILYCYASGYTLPNGAS